MANLKDVEQFFIDCANSLDDEITNLRLNKLLFFAQAWNLVHNNKPLFNESFEAWDLGPVIPSVYHKYKPFGRNSITTDGNVFNPNVFTDEELEVLLGVQTYYGKFATSTLVNISHAANSPWESAIKNDCTKISNDIIKSYYSSLNKEDELFNVEEDLVSSIPITELQRDRNGVLMASAEDCDGWEM